MFRAFLGPVGTMVFLASLLGGCYASVHAEPTTPVVETGVVYHAPPEPRVVVVHRPPAPYDGATWVDGHWSWNGYQYVWVDGYWVAPRAGFVYVQPRWVRRGGGYVYVSGAYRPVHSRTHVYVAPAPARVRVAPAPARVQPARPRVHGGVQVRGSARVSAGRR